MWAYALCGWLAGGLLSAVLDYFEGERASVVDVRSWCEALKRGHRQPALHRTLLIEATCAALFGYLWSIVGPSLRLMVLSVYMWVLLLVLIVDLRQRLVYNVVLAPAAMIALVASLVTPPPGLTNALLGGLTGFALLAMVALAYPQSLGQGDVKLAGVIGLMAGFPNVLIALILGILAGGFVAGLLLAMGVVNRRSYIPYAPFLAVGAIVTLIHGAGILNWYLWHLRG